MQILRPIQIYQGRWALQTVLISSPGDSDVFDTEFQSILQNCLENVLNSSIHSDLEYFVYEKQKCLKFILLCKLQNTFKYSHFFWTFSTIISWAVEVLLFCSTFISQGEVECKRDKVTLQPHRLVNVGNWIWIQS